MTKAASFAPFGQTQLAHLLTQLGVASARAPKKLFADRFAELIDLPDAFELSDFLKTVNRVPIGEVVDGSGPLPLFELQRTEMVEAIHDCFKPRDPESLPNSGGFSLPFTKPELLTGGDEAFGVYLRFYAIQQSEMERRVSALRNTLRKHMAATCKALAELVAIEVALDDTLTDYSRRSLAVLPKLLGERFFTLRAAQIKNDAASGNTSTPDEWLAEGAWLNQFHREMKKLLLAELALRLQPIEGMLDAMNLEYEETR